MDMHTLFGPEETARLVDFRDRYRSGTWPRPFVDPRAVGADITFVAEEAHRDDSRIVFTCVFSRPRYLDQPQLLVVTFQVLAANPEAPGRDEVLRWLVALASDSAERHEDWHVFLDLTRSAPATRAYRGLVEPRFPEHRRESERQRTAAEIRAFLGEAYLRHLLEQMALHP